MHNDFESLVATYANSIATGASLEESLRHLQALNDWYEQVVNLADYVMASDYSHINKNGLRTCNACSAQAGKYGLIFHKEDCPIEFVSILLSSDDY